MSECKSPPHLTRGGFMDYGAYERANPTSPTNLLIRVLQKAQNEIREVTDGTSLWDDLQMFMDAHPPKPPAL